MKNVIALCSVLCLVAYNVDALAATKKTAKQSVLQTGTNVRAKVEASGLYDEECYNAFYGCMDQFCITENANGGTCTCNDLSIKYEQEYADIQKKMLEAERIATVEVEKVKAGADADIIFSGERKYDADGNIVDPDEVSESENNKSKYADLLDKLKPTFEDDEEEYEIDADSIANKTGNALFKAAEELCLEQVPESCSGDIKLLRQMYSRQITADCKAFENMIATKALEADQAMNKAESDVRVALKESFDSANKYDLGTCLVEFKKCMTTDDACGSDWEGCVSLVANENMQNNVAATNAGTTVESANAYDITASTMDILNSKRIICERVLDQCVVVRDQVWPAFLREAAPTIKIAETKAESKMRQSCLTDISDCIQKACKDDIAGKGVDTMDACLSRPDMARSFCKVEIDRCERMEPLIWGYVTDKLKAMRVDACTQEVKDCFTAETRCGANFENCIGMDYDYIHDICPIDSLVVCKANNPEFSMNDLDSMLMGLYLNIDNAALDNCQALVDAKMMEVCGSTTDCNRFASDSTIGTGSLRSQKDGNVYRVTGMISFGSIKMGMASTSVTDAGSELQAGQIGVADYLAKITEKNNKAGDSNIIASIEEELNNIAGTINRTIEMIEMDPEIQYCVTGRSLKQITGKEESTQARFPNLLNQLKMQIAVSALHQAQENYNAKLKEAIAKASKDASADVAQYMCQMMPVTGGASVGATNDQQTYLAEPYAISYEVGTGLDNNLLTQGGRGSGMTSGTAVQDGTAGASKFSEAVNSFTGLGSNKTKVEMPGGTREMWSIFNRDTRICHYCTSTVTKKCTSVSKKGFLGIGASNEMNCDESAPVEKCEDIQM